jgi:Na+(H+)/acetate symporter ActP
MAALIFCLMVGTEFAKPPAWVAQWVEVETSLLSVVDMNKDPIFKLGKMRVGKDIIDMVTPEIGGLTYIYLKDVLTQLFKQLNSRIEECLAHHL